MRARARHSKYEFVLFRFRQHQTKNQIQLDTGNQMWNVNLAIVHHILLTAVTSRRDCFFFHFIRRNRKKNIRMYWVVSQRKIRIIDNTFNVVALFSCLQCSERETKRRETAKKTKEKKRSVFDCPNCACDIFKLQRPSYSVCCRWWTFIG